jgi:hypothetical protein
MPLHLPSSPSNARDLIAQAISRLSMAGGAADAVAAVEDPSRLNAALQHQVYTLGATDIAQGRNLSQARLVAWRFLIQYGQKTIAAVEFSCNSQGGNLRFSSLDTGLFAQATRDAAAQAEALDVVKNGEYEFRVLRVPSVYVMAVWLKNLQGRDDVVIPIDPARKTVGGPATGGGIPLPQSSTDFVKAMRDPAKSSLAFFNAPDPGRAPAGGAPANAPNPNPPSQKKPPSR